MRCTLALSRRSVILAVPQLLLLRRLLAATGTSLQINDLKFSYKNGKWSFVVRDAVVNGLTFPTFTWSWVGLAIAQGILAAAGGQVFAALFSALQANKQDLQRLLTGQLQAFARIMSELLDSAFLREYEADISAYTTLFTEYLNDPSERRLDFLVNNTAIALARVQSLGFRGYPGFMTTAGLRLSVLQELKQTKGAKANFAAQRSQAIAHHESTRRYIDAETDPYEMVKRDGARLEFSWTPVFSGLPLPGWQIFRHQNQQALGGVIDGKYTAFDPNGNYKSPGALVSEGHLQSTAVDWMVDWSSRRNTIRAASTDRGDAMVALWSSSPSAAVRRAVHQRGTA